MRKLRIYLDTSVIGGCFDQEFKIWSNGLIDDFRNERFQLVLSDVTAVEVDKAPEPVRKLFNTLATISENLSVTEEVLDVLTTYENHEVLNPRYRTDMLHIALATVAEVDVLVSWNFKHIVRLDKIQKFNGINLELGYKTIGIYSPREVTTYGREDTN
jgi:hypothetical protein